MADTWCVNLEKEYEYNGEEHTPGKPSTAPPVKTEEENSGSITNSSLASKVRNKAYSEAKSWLNGQQVDGTVTSVDVLDGKQTTKINTTITRTTTIDTTTTSYTGKAENFHKDETPKFATVFNKHYNARSSILSGKAWFFEALESNADTVNIVDLTKYLMYKATGASYGVTTFDFKIYNPSDFSDVEGSSANDISSGTIYGNSFEEKVWYTLAEKYSEIAAAGAMGNFAQESGFKANNLQNSYETSLGYSDESYTKAVNNGSYSRNNFIYDEAGYGLAQWTYWSRKAELYDFAKQQGAMIDNEEMQIQFLLKEIQTHCTKWQKSTTVSEAAVNFHNEFENSNDSESQIQERVRSAEELYKKYKGKKRPASSSFPRYYQSDSKWSSNRYGSSTIGEAGCGACALAMAVSGLTGKTVEPPEIVDYLNSKGISTAAEAEGTNGARAIAQKYGLTIEVVNKDNKSKIDAALDQGKVCMFSVSSNGVYTGAGHYILCYRRDNKGYYIVESGRFYDPSKPYSYEKTMGSSNNGGMVNILGK